MNIILIASVAALLMLDGLVFYRAFIHGPLYFGISFAEFSAFLLFFVLLYALSRRGHPLLSSNLLIATLFLGNSYAMYVWGVNLPVALLAYAFIISISGILGGTSFGFFMAALSACASVIVWHMHINGIVVPRPRYPSEDDTIIFTAFYFLIMTVIWLSNRETERSLARARDSERELKGERDLLEERIEERTNELRDAQLERMEHVHYFAEFGRLASGLFHDLLNLMNAISLRTEGHAGEEALLAEACTTTRQIRHFMRTIRKQLGKNDPYGAFSLVEGIEEVIQLVSHRANKESIRIAFRYDKKDLLPYSGVSFKFHQVVINLLINAMDAYDDLPDGEAARRTVTVSAHKNDGFIFISVMDKGCGIPEGLHERIFEPFFTTKTRKNGTGIGLATIKKIIEEDFYGSIAVRSGKDIGSTFTVALPTVPPSFHSPI